MAKQTNTPKESRTRQAADAIKINQAQTNILPAAALDVFVQYGKVGATLAMQQVASGLAYVLNVSQFRDKSDPQYKGRQAAVAAMKAAMVQAIGESMSEISLYRRYSLISVLAEKIEGSPTIVGNALEPVKNAKGAKEASDALLNWFKSKGWDSYDALRKAIVGAGNGGDADEKSDMEKVSGRMKSLFNDVDKLVKDHKVRPTAIAKELANRAPKPTLLVNELLARIEQAEPDLVWLRKVHAMIGDMIIAAESEAPVETLNEEAAPAKAPRRRRTATAEANAAA